jgi:hypothetical protein
LVNLQFTSSIFDELGGTESSKDTGRDGEENHLESGCVHKARRHVKSSGANAGPYIARGRLGSDHTLDGSKEELVALIVDSLDSH